MTKDEDYWCNVFGIPAQQTYVEPKPESTRLLNGINCTNMTVNLEYKNGIGCTIQMENT